MDAQEESSLIHLDHLHKGLSGRRGERRDRPAMPYPGGESWEQAVHRVERFLRDLPLRWSKRRVLIIGHPPLPGEPGHGTVLP